MPQAQETPALEQQVLEAFQGRDLAVHTINNYCRQAGYFVQYCQQYHQCTTLTECRPYADEWLMSRSHLSPYTQALDAVSLAKLYGGTSSDFYQAGGRDRDSITRSRKKSVRDRFFSEERNRDFVDFCRGTGLTRSELKALTGDQLRIEGCSVYIEMPSRGQNCTRKVPVIGNVDLIVRMMREAGTGRVFRKIFVAADIQSYRADYARAIYQMHARDFETCQTSPFTGNKHSSGRSYGNCVYWLRGSRQGQWLDKHAMKMATDTLGLKRFSSYAEHYLR